MIKPPYRVPTMQEIREIPWNGLKIASTFSGCGGSCTGYRMAGYKVVWANEFVPAAQASYKANAAEDCYLDCRDIREVKPDEILGRIGMRQGELDLFDGSPPCQAFSTAGKRDKGWGKDKTYEHGAKQQNEKLFDEYIRLLRGLRPKTFVAENVSGLVKGTAKGYFLEILRKLKESGYRVACKVLDAQWLGVPQQRQRTIFIGVREDLEKEPVYPKPLSYQYSVQEALPDLLGSRVEYHGFSKQNNVLNLKSVSPTIMASGASQQRFQVEINRYAIGQEWDKLSEGEHSKRFFSLVRCDRNKPAPCIQASHGNLSTAGVTHPTEKRKFTIEELKRICAFPDDFILCGSYSQQWERLGNSVPPLMMRAVAEVIRDKILCPTI